MQKKKKMGSYDQQPIEILICYRTPLQESSVIYSVGQTDITSVKD